MMIIINGGKKARLQQQQMKKCCNRRTPRTPKTPRTPRTPTKASARLIISSVQAFVFLCLFALLLLLLLVLVLVLLLLSLLSLLLLLLLLLLMSWRQTANGQIEIYESIVRVSIAPCLFHQYGWRVLFIGIRCWLVHHGTVPKCDGYFCFCRWMFGVWLNTRRWVNLASSYWEINVFQIPATKWREQRAALGSVTSNIPQIVEFHSFLFDFPIVCRVPSYRP